MAHGTRKYQVMRSNVAIFWLYQGFICPVCMISFNSAEDLQIHFETAHVDSEPTPSSGVSKVFNFPHEATAVRLLHSEFIIFLEFALHVASHKGVFKGGRVSSLLTNACSTDNNIPFPRLANHIVLSKFWKVNLDRKVTSQLLDLP